MKAKETLEEKTARLKALRLAHKPKYSPPPAESRASKVWYLSDELTFGQYSGLKISEVLDSERGYSWVKWALENVKGFELAKDAQQEFDSYDDPRRP